MKISKKLAIKILKYLNQNTDFYFPFQIMCREHSDEDGELVEIEPSSCEMVEKDEKYKTFELWENLQNLDEQTLQLMAKGFLEKITNKSLENQIATLAKKYRKEWKKELWESEDIEEFGRNEFINGKAEGCEECLNYIKLSRYGK